MECSVIIEATVDETDPDAVFSRLSDFASYPDLTPSVRSVEVTESENSFESSWEVNFRKGLLRWTETDEFDHESRVIVFEQIRGDLASFNGTWAVSTAGDDGGRCVVRFTSRFDLGIVSLADIVDPIACTAMTEGISQILQGLFGDHIAIETIKAGPVDADLVTL